jgi:hypothetical protein
VTHMRVRLVALLDAEEGSSSVNVNDSTRRGSGVAVARSQDDRRLRRRTASSSVGVDARLRLPVEGWLVRGTSDGGMARECARAAVTGSSAAARDDGKCGGAEARG